MFIKRGFYGEAIWCNVEEGIKKVRPRGWPKIADISKHSTQYTHYKLKLSLPLHNNILTMCFNWYFKETITLVRFQYMLPDDGPKDRNM
jgi:hypothetical protein